MKNNKGFTLVEILGVVTILGIMMSLAIIGYTRYIESSKNKSYNFMAQSASQAAENYYMDYPTVRTVTFQQLVEDQYLEPTIDPATKSEQCSGKVNITVDNTTGIDVNSYEVIMCCSNVNYTYTFPGGHRVKNDHCEA